MEVRNEEKEWYYFLPKKQRAIIDIAEKEGLLEYYHAIERKWCNKETEGITQTGIYRTKPKEEG